MVPRWRTVEAALTKLGPVIEGRLLTPESTYCSKVNIQKYVSYITASKCSPLIGVERRHFKAGAATVNTP